MLGTMVRPQLNAKQGLRHRSVSQYISHWEDPVGPVGHCDASFPSKVVAEGRGCTYGGGVVVGASFVAPCSPLGPQFSGLMGGGGPWPFCPRCSQCCSGFREPGIFAV